MLPTNKQVDVLFLYRTPKKKRYFTILREQAVAAWQCDIQGYYALPSTEPNRSSAPVTADILFKAEQELYNAKSDFWQLIKSLTKPVLLAQIKQLYSRLFAYLSQTQPKLIVIWNGHKWQDHVLHAVNKHFNIPIVYFENGVLPKSTTMDFCGINALNSVPRQADFYRALPSPKSSRKMKIKGRKYKKNSHLVTCFERPKKYLLVPFQKDRDSQILDNSAWIKSMAQLFSVMTEALTLCQQKDLHIVFREHPSAKTKYVELYKQAEKHPRICFDGQSDLAEVIAHAEAVVTINSTVGLESMLLNTKVITLGDAFYNIDDLVLTADSTTDLAEKINQLYNFEPDQALLKNFIDYLDNEYVIPGSWKKPNDTHLQAIAKRFNDGLTGLNVDQSKLTTTTVLKNQVAC